MFDWLKGARFLQGATNDQPVTRQVGPAPPATSSRDEQHNGWNGAGYFGPGNTALTMWSDNTSQEAKDAAANNPAPLPQSGGKNDLAASGDNGGTLTVTHSNTTGGDTWANTASVGASMAKNGTAGLNLANTNVSNSDGKKTTETTTFGMTGGNGTAGFTGGDSTTIKDGSSTTTSGSTFGASAGNGTVAANYGASSSTTVDNDGVDETSSMKANVGGEIDGQGISKINGSYSQQTADGNKFGLSGNLRRDGGGAAASIGNSDFGVGGNFDITAGKIEQDAAVQTGGLNASLLGGSYISTTRTDSASLGANVDMKELAVHGGVNSGSKIEVFEQMDKTRWDGMSTTERQNYLDAQQAALANYQDGLAGLDLLQMQSGTGVHLTSFNGWNAGAGLSLGAVGVNGGFGQTTANDVTIVRPSSPTAPIVVNVASQEGLAVNGGLNVAGVSAGFKNNTANTEQTQFTIDPAKLEIDPQTGQPKFPETYAAVHEFLETGLLPGAAKLQDPAAQTAYQKFDAARDQVEDLNTKIADAKTRLGTDSAASAELIGLQRELDDAQAAIDLNRNYLNKEWRAENGAAAEPVPGVVVTNKEEDQSSSFSANVMGVDIGHIDEKWTASEYAAGPNDPQNRFGYSYDNWFFGSHLGDFSTTSDTSTNGVMLGLHSGHHLDDDPEMLALAAGIDNGSAASDTLVNDKYFRDRAQYSLSIQLNETQLMGMANSLNDPNNPESKQMWADFGERTGAFMSGGKWWEDADMAELGSYGISKDDYDKGRDDQRNLWLYTTFNGDPKDPTTAALRAMGGTQEEAMQQATTLFSGVTNPDEFKKLSPENQQLFMTILDQTSGGEDMSGKHSGYEAIACVALIENPIARADSMNKLIADNNQSGESHFDDAGWDFVRFAERFKTSDPATYDLLQQGMRLDATTGELETFNQQSTEDVTKSIGEAYNCRWAFWQDIDPQEDTIVNGMLSLQQRQDPKLPPGTAITEMLKQTGMDPLKVLAQFPADKPAERELFIEMMKDTQYGPAIEQAIAAQNGQNGGQGTP